MAVPSGRYRFTGREFDSETGLQYHRDRYYDPATGRWLTEDRLRGEDSNPYRYVRNNPVNAVDPTGRKRRIVLRFSYQELQRRKLPAKEIDYLKRNNAKYARTIFEFFTAAGLKNGAYGQQELRFNPPLRSTGGGNLEVQAIYDLNTQKLVRAGFVLKYATKTADGKKRFVDYGFEFYDSVEELLRVYRLNIQVMQAAQGTVAFLAFSGVGFSVPIYEPLPRLRRPAPRPRPQRPQPPPNTQTRRLSSLEEGPVLDDFKPGDSGFFRRV
ncbi:MAG: hypothetical protein KatS3mg105_1266 [Gemmatales bacterium]|nr:MAG: hypothetical protein KatS3mg105_1266 [Gemmatales bacterium]